MTATQQQVAKPVPSQKPSRMTLASVVKGKLDAPLRLVLYGVEGVGKSTFGAQAPKPIFLGAEDGTQHLDVERFQKPDNLGEVFEALRVLTDDAHEYQTLVVDTLDWLEPLIWREVCSRDGVKLIEDVGGGYGKGYTASVDEWRRILASLERLQAAKKMHVLLLAHSHIKTFKNPEGEDFDRYQIKIHEKSAGPIKEWADAVLFAKHETLAHKDSKKRVRGVSTGARIIHAERTAAYDAKNRYSLPETLPLSWADFFAAAKGQQAADPAALVAEIERKAKQLGGALETDALAAIKRAGGDAVKLAQLNSWANSKLIEREN